MEVFFRLPHELQSHTLCFLSASELTYLFELNQLLDSSDFASCVCVSSAAKSSASDPFLAVRHLALQAKYYREPVTLSNDSSLANLTLGDLQYFARYNIIPSPSELNLVVFDISDQAAAASFFASVITNFLRLLHCFTAQINVKLILLEKEPPRNDAINELMTPLKEFAIANFTIKYLPIFGRFLTREPNSSPADTSLEEIPQLPVTSLLLHFLDSSHVLRHLSRSLCGFQIDNLRCMDLSYNHLTEWHLLQISFPASIEELRLSNNSISFLCSETFRVEGLTKLRLLDLSNNNLMRIDLSSHMESDEPYKLQDLNLSGNLLNSYSSMWRCPFFANLKKIDLSRNLLDEITEFPSSLRRIDLFGNYINFDMNNLDKIFPEDLELLSINSPSFMSGTHEPVRQFFMKQANLRNLRCLDVCGMSWRKYLVL